MNSTHLVLRSHVLRGLRVRAIRLLMIGIVVLQGLGPVAVRAQSGDAAPAPSAPLPALLADEWPAAADFTLSAAGLPLEGPIVLDGALVQAHSAMAADLDNDGNLDVISAARGAVSAAGVESPTGGNLIWYRNLGGPNPSFEARPIAPVSGAYLAWPADLNRDGHIDIVVAAVIDVNPSASAAAPTAPAGSGAVYWFQNNGQTIPAFTQRTVADALAYPVSARVGDLNGDGNLDIVVPTRDDNRVRWFESSGGPTPTFTAHTIADGVMSAVAVDVGDVDGDGDLDVVSASEDDDRILWYANDGQGVFSTLTVRPGQPDPNHDFAKSVFLADLDRDGDLDIAYGSEERNEVGWYRNNGGNPPQWEQRVVVQNRNHVKIVSAADLDLDGDLDLLSASSDDGVFAWYRNDGASTPTFAPYTIAAGAAGARFISTGDLDGDGDPDVLGASRDNNQVVWFHNRLVHRTALFPSQSIHMLGSYKDARHVRGADLDSDGDTDLITVNEDTLIWHESNGGSPPTFVPHQITSSQDRGRWVEPADVDADGDMDILLASTKNGRVYWYENNGAHPPAFAEHTMSNQLVGPRAVMTADLDRDGDLDAFAAADGEPGAPSRIAWFENNGAHPPAFTTHIIDETGGNYARSIFPVDIDNDGDTDLLSAEQVGDRVMLYVNNGARPPGFEKRVVAQGTDSLTGADGAQHVHAADMDGDGDQDVIFGADTGNRVVWVENLDGKGGSFATHIVDGTVTSVHAVVASDVDRDGDSDILAAVEGSNQILWYENNGQRPPAFAKHVLLDPAPTAHGISIADMEGDGDVDVLAAARDAGFYWFENLGGQYQLYEESFAIASGAPNAVTAEIVVHNGRSGDASVELGALAIDFVDEGDNVLSTDELIARARAILIYADTNGNGKLDPASDRLVATENDLSKAANGRITINLALSPPSVGVGAGGAFRFFAVASLSSACGAIQLARPVVRTIAGVVVDSLAGGALLAAGHSSIGSGAPVTAADPPTFLRVNEIAANPAVGDDWFEIYNSGKSTVNMAGMYLTDDPGAPKKYQIPNGISIAPHGYVIFIADDEGELLHTNFQLKGAGESVGLFDTDARQNRLLDLVTYEAQPPGVSSGRIPDGAKVWRKALLAPSAGSANERAGLGLNFFIPVVQRNLGC